MPMVSEIKYSSFFSFKKIKIHIEFKDSTGRGLYKTKMDMNNMHKALLLDHNFLRELEPELTAKGINFPGGGGLENINQA